MFRILFHVGHARCNVLSQVPKSLNVMVGLMLSSLYFALSQSMAKNYKGNDTLYFDNEISTNAINFGLNLNME